MAPEKRKRRAQKVCATSIIKFANPKLIGGRSCSSESWLQDTLVPGWSWWSGQRGRTWHPL